MAKKQELLDEAKKLKLDVSSKPTIKELEELISKAKKEDGDGSTEKGDKAETETNQQQEVAEAKRTAAKAGKRSEKGLKEAEVKAEKIEKQHSKADDEVEQSKHETKKGPAPKTRTKAERRSKNYKKSAELIDSAKEYTLKEASDLLPKTSTVKFDASVELHINLGVDPKQADQNVRASVSLPHGTGKTLRVAVFAPEDQHEALKKAGADIVGEDSLLKQLDSEKLDFDVLIATPQLMAKLGKYARILGPKGLMPNPKSGTVTAKPADAVKDAKKGKVEFRVDKQSIVHQAVGKVSFTPQQIEENAKTVLKAIADAKPASVKGIYVQRIYMTTTMGPSIKIALSEIN